MQEFCHARIRMNTTPPLQVHASIDQKGRMIQRIDLRIKEDNFQAFKLNKIHPTGFEIVPDW